MLPDKSIVTRDTDDDDTETEWFAVPLDKPTPEFKYLSGLRFKDKENNTSSTWNGPGSLGGYCAWISDLEIECSADSFQMVLLCFRMTTTKAAATIPTRGRTETRARLVL